MSNELFYYDFVISKPKATTIRIKIAARSPKKALGIWFGVPPKHKYLKYLCSNVVAVVEFKSTSLSRNQSRFHQTHCYQIESLKL